MVTDPFSRAGSVTGDRGDVTAGPFGQWAQRTRQRYTQVLVQAAASMVEAVTVGNLYSTGTPVDTGFARASWVISVGAPSSDRPLGDTPGAHAAPGSISAPDYGAAVATWDGAVPLYATNNVVYVPLLEYGYTVPLNAATPPGWVAQAVRQWPAMVGDATRAVRANVTATVSAASLDAYQHLLTEGLSG